MIKKRCSFCDGKGYIGNYPEAIEVFVAELLNLDAEIPKYVVCPRCQGEGIEYEVELKDLCKITA